MKRIFLLVVTNIAVMVLLTLVVHALGLDRYLYSQGYNVGGLLAFAAVFGFGGAFISLAISKWSAKRLMGVQVINQPRTAAESWLLNTVKQHADRAGISMPEVGVFESPEMNAFATGARRNSALVAVSTGLLNGMEQKEAEAVLGHEISHVANGDMVTLTLIQGVVNTFVIFLARVIGNFVDRAVFRNEGGRGIAYIATVIVAEIVLGLFRQHDRHVVLAPAGVPRRCGRRAARGHAEHDRRPGAVEDRTTASPASGPAGADRGVRHYRRRATWLQTAVHEPSAAG